MKQDFVRAHNAKRDQVAGGNLSGFESAVRMGAMEWDNNLAELAELNVRDCYFHHDSCHNTKIFKYSGQNIAYFPLDRSNPDPKKTALEAIDVWFDEYKDATMANIDINQPSSGKVIGHFTVLVHELNVRVGCAAAQFSDKSHQYVYTVCNYAYTNYYGKRVYEAGPAASKCKSGTDSKFPNLCSKMEYVKN